MSGFVSLVGAGPGDPELLSLKAVDRLVRADLILYDALASPAVLDHAPRARRLYVGKRARRKAVSQETIHGLMVRAARRGERVVRLKGGDPFVLGRGGEEALALQAAGVPFEVVPGMTSAVAAPGALGVPVTHRGICSAFAVVAAHDRRANRNLRAIEPQSMTIVVLMGLGRRREVAEQLLDNGWRADTPAAISFAATTPEAAGWIGTLSELGTADVRRLAPGCPGTLVIGDVVQLASVIGQPTQQTHTIPPKIVAVE